MRSSMARYSTFAAGTAAALCLLAVPATAATTATPTAPAAPASHRPGVLALPQHPGPAGVRVVSHPLLVKVRGYTQTGRALLATGAPGGYTAPELRAYLQLRGTGAGQTVAIVDAFDDPYATSDITTYSQQFGLPLPCKRPSKHPTTCFDFQVVHPFGIGGYDPGWALEESLDFEMVHAIAPRATIVLVEAHDDTDTAMFAAVSYAAGLHPAVISNSWGESEFAGETSDDQYCQLTTGVCTFASGDSGNPGLYPATSPDVIATGGTTLSLTAAGAVTSETAWPGSGGGVSQYQPRPAYQDRVSTYPGRSIPDVSFDADPHTGVAVYDSGYTGWLEVGGTSVAAPAWAGILAAADQLRAAAGKGPLTAASHQAQQALYGLSSGLADITTGSNGTCGAICTAGPGYDLVTGLGSPRPGIDTALAAAP